MAPYDLNRFHLLVLATWQFSIFFAVQQIFPIFLVYVPEWRCISSGSKNQSFPESWLEYSRKCEVYQNCPKSQLEVKNIYFSAAMEFGWICTGMELTAI